MNKNWKVLSKFLGIILIVFIIVLLNVVGFLYIRGPHWTMEEEIDDRTIRPLAINVSSIKEGLPLATARAYEWRRDAVLSSISVFSKGEETVKNRKGEILYKYFVLNHDSWGYPEAHCYVTIDLTKQAITRFEAAGYPKRSSEPMNIDRWALDIPDIFQIVEKTNSVSQYSNPMLIIRPGEIRCFVTVGAAPDVWASERTEIIINSSTREIERIEKYPRSSIPR